MDPNIAISSEDSMSIFGSLIKSLSSSNTPLTSNHFKNESNDPNVPSTSSNPLFSSSMGLDFSIPEASTSSSNILLRTPRKIRSYTIGQKLEVIKFANEQSINAAHRKFGIDRKCIRTWRKNEDNLLNLQESNTLTPMKKRRPGAGRKVKDMSFDEDLAKWMKNELDEGRNPSRAHIQWKALEMAYNSGDVNQEFKASTGWLEKFLTRHNFRPRQPTPSEVLRMHGNSFSNAPKDAEAKKKGDFAEYVQEMRQQNNYDYVYLAYKTSILIDKFGEMCGDGQVENEQQNEKICVSMILTVRSDGQKLLPFVILPQQTSSSIFTFTQQLHLIWSENSEIDDELVPEYLQNVFGKDPVCKRLVLWNTFGCQLSEELSQFLENNQIWNTLIPSKFNDFKQLLKSRLESVFKKELLAQYSNWRLNGENPTTSTASNEKLGSLSMNSFLNWIVQAWSTVSERSIAELFITQEVKDAMNQLMGNADQFISTGSSLKNEISTVEETYQDDYKKFLDKIIETIGLEITSANNNSSSNPE